MTAARSACHTQERAGHGVLRELKQVTSALTAGHSYTLTLISHDENNPGDATDTTYDDITTS